MTDLPCFGRRAVLAWRKFRWECQRECGSFTEQAPAIAAPRLKLTDRAGRWATVQVGRHGRLVTEVAKDLGCGWHPVMDAVAAYGQALVDDPARFGDVSVLGLDETLRCRVGEWRRQQWTTQIVEVGAGQLLDVVAGRTAAGPIERLEQQPADWRAGIRWATLDLSGPYRKTFDVMLPDAVLYRTVSFALGDLRFAAGEQLRALVSLHAIGHPDHVLVCASNCTSIDVVLSAHTWVCSGATSRCRPGFRLTIGATMSPSGTPRAGDTRGQRLHLSASRRRPKQSSHNP